MMLSILASLFFLQASAITSLKSDHVQIQLITPQEQIGNDNQLQVAVHYKMDPHWHIYWKNPGDSGASPKFQVEGGNLTAVHWPYPKRIPVKDLTNFGYENEVALLLDVQVAPDVKDVKLNLEWLICRVECIPGFGELKLPLRRGNESKLKAEKNPERILYEKFKNLVPQSSHTWKTSAIKKGTGFYQIELIPEDGQVLTTVSEAFFFPEDGETFLTKAPQIETLEKTLRVSLPISPNAKNTKSNFPLTIVLKNRDTTVEFFTAEIPNEPEDSGFALGLLFAFLGGLILNLMPCVFPVLSLKVFSFLKEQDHTKIRKSSWAYTAGVLISFLVIGGFLTVLRLSGEAVGWGYQLQSPWVVYVLVVLFYLMALNFWGFFEIGNNLANSAGHLGQSRALSGSFGTGVLAVLVASPCTAPFMGSALGLTLLLPWHQSLLVFLVLGFGMALPMLVLAYIPKLISFLPRSGMWMQYLKQFMAFPMLATGLWLLWVLDKQKGSDVVFVALGSLLLLTLAIWCLSTAKGKSLKLFCVLFAIGVFLLTAQYVRSADGVKTSIASSSAWQDFNQELISKEMTLRPIFIDFTASWCITCQVNKKGVLEATEIQDAFRKNNVLLIRGDWTNYDPAITNALASFGRNSVPLYVFYNRTSEPKVLPQLLTRQMIKDLFYEGE